MRLRDLTIGALRQGPIPQHIAIVMDGNRRFARSRQIEVVEGHNRGFEALAQVSHCSAASSLNIARQPPSEPAQAIDL